MPNLPDFQNRLLNNPARQFMLASLIILTSGMLLIGFWISNQVTSGVLHRSGELSGVYANSLISHVLEGRPLEEPIPEWMEASLSNHLDEQFFEREIALFMLWNPQGTLLYSSSPYVSNPPHPNPRAVAAASGEIVTGVTDHGSTENIPEAEIWDSLIETYVPIYGHDRGKIIAVAEIYQDFSPLRAEIVGAQRRSWMFVGGSTLLMYLLMAGIATRAHHTIQQQQQQLMMHLSKLQEALDLNRFLRQRVTSAAARTTALNERFLHRLSADLHDGPGQLLSLALLRFGSLAGGNGASGSSSDSDFQTVHNAIETALEEIRSIASGLRLPHVESLELEATMRRAIRDHEKLTGRSIRMRFNSIPTEALFPIKITAYRVLQEALANGYKHAQGAPQWVYACGANGQLCILIRDYGPGLDHDKNQTSDTLGLHGMRDRISVLGGQFEIQSTPGKGTRVIVSLPLNMEELPNA